MVRSFTKFRVLAAAGLMAIAGSAQVSVAQDFGGGRGGGGFGGGMFTAGVNSRDLERYEDMLNLTRDQRDTVKALFEGYQEQTRNKGQELRDKMQDARDQMRDGDAAARRGFGQMMMDFRQQRQKMDDAFFSDVQAVLTDEQKAIWPKVERTRRREQNIGRGLMSGERADVIRIIQDEKLPADVMTKVAPVLDQYEVDLDRELSARVKLFDENMSKAMELMGQGDPATMAEKFEPLLKQTREASIRVRDVNRRAAHQVEELLPEDKKSAFEKAFREASFPSVYRTSQASRQMTAALGLADITEEQKTAIAALRESHDRDEAAVQEKLAAAIEQSEMTMTADQMMRRFGGGMMMGGGRGGQGGGPGNGQGQGNQNGGRGNRGGDGGNGQANGGNRGGGAPPTDQGGRGRFGQFEEGPVADLRERSREIDRNTQDSLKKILKPEQVDRLPSPDDRNRGGDAPRNRRNQNNRT